MALYVGCTTYLTECVAIDRVWLPHQQNSTETHTRTYIYGSTYILHRVH